MLDNGSEARPKVRGGMRGSGEGAVQPPSCEEWHAGNHHDPKHHDPSHRSDSRNFSSLVSIIPCPAARHPEDSVGLSLLRDEDVMRSLLERESPHRQRSLSGYGPSPTCQLLGKGSQPSPQDTRSCSPSTLSPISHRRRASSGCLTVAIPHSDEKQSQERDQCGMSASSPTITIPALDQRSSPRQKKHVHRHVSASYHGLDRTASKRASFDCMHEFFERSPASTSPPGVPGSPLRSVDVAPTRSDWATTIRALLPLPSPSVSYLRDPDNTKQNDEFMPCLMPSSPLLAVRKGSPPHPWRSLSSCSSPMQLKRYRESRMSGSASKGMSIDFGSLGTNRFSSAFSNTKPESSENDYGILFQPDDELGDMTKLWRQTGSSTTDSFRCDIDMDELSVESLSFPQGSPFPIPARAAGSGDYSDEADEETMFCMEDVQRVLEDDVCEAAITVTVCDDEDAPGVDAFKVANAMRENLPPPAEVAIDWKYGGSQRMFEARDSLSSLDFDTLLLTSDDLVHLAMDIFESLDLPAKVGVDTESIKRLVSSVQGYMFDNTYHNWHHAFDVFQSTYALATQMGTFDRLSDVEAMALLVSALCHDLEHPGVTNPFLVGVRSELAIIYNDRSVLENHHCCRCFQLLYHQSIDFFKNWKDADILRFREVAVANIMATDMARHGEYINRLRARATGTNFEEERDVEIMKEMEIVIKIADIGNVGKPFPCAMKWAVRITEELFMQGDLEARAGVPVTAMCNRSLQSRVQLQKGFIDHVVEPFHELLSQAYPPMACAFPHTKSNRKVWDLYNDSLLEQEVGKTFGHGAKQL